MDKVLEEIAAERKRQIKEEGWTTKHDDTHDRGEMALAAACYAASGSGREDGVLQQSSWWSVWPWDLKWWKPKDRRRDLVRAGALIVAEIERLDRAEPQETPSD